MKATLPLIAVVTLLATAAQGQTIIESCQPTPQGGYNCTTQILPPSTPEPPARPTPEEQARSDARAEQWEAYCRPRIVQDRDGVERYRYAHPGCDVGRTGP